MNTVDAVEIEDAENAHGDGISFCRGHVDKAAFAERVNREVQDNRLTANDFKHEWWREVSAVDEDGEATVKWLTVKEGEDGAFPVTVEDF